MANRQTGRQRDSQTDRLACRQKGIGRQADMAGRQARARKGGRQALKLVDRPADRKVGRHAGRQGGSRKV